ncbi:Methylamine utilisation protein MauE [Asanoa hainanensis]|uniref:Methylamine utilisation protein MauE n=1 Tax=Asanoa hainanensis TaxID=560556 RepID=A0A239PEM0_9ACTN|nr:MauE/DoxX family redox-associated membrane protein [Asanoa hainanensis]SNT65480.1 Methylamine utilisation protein MauE [Asanoa hainanensis]
MEYVVVATRVVMAVVFVAALASKVRGRPSFKAFVRSVRPWVSARRAPAVALFVVAAESLCVVLLVLPGAGGAGLAAAAAVLVGFTAAIGRAISTRRAATCRCFGSSERPLTMIHVVRNGLLLTLALCGLAANANGSPAVSHDAGLLIAASTGVATALILMRLDDVVDLLRPGRAW